MVLNQGPMEQFPHSIEPQLRALGLPTSLKRGVVHLIAEEYTVCKKGDILTSEQARILKLLGRKQATFRYVSSIQKISVFFIEVIAFKILSLTSIELGAPKCKYHERMPLC